MTINPAIVLPAPWGDLVDRFLSALPKNDRQVLTGLALVALGFYVIGQAKG